MDLDLAMMSPYFLRAELAGPLGVRMGLVQINNDWVQFYDSRKRQVERLPLDEFRKNSLRRDRFLAVLPFPIPGPHFVDYALSRSGLPDDESGEKLLRSCVYDEDRNAYEILYVDKSELETHYSWHLLEIDPTNFFPLRHRISLRPRAQVLTNKDTSWSLAEWDLRYSHFVGEGFATLPRVLDVYRREALAWSFEWLEAERILDRGEEIFLWRPSASITVKDF
jgi:hypothetical protein